MSMKSHILAAVREGFLEWDSFLTSMDEQQLIARSAPDAWSIKDDLAHIIAWMQRSNAYLTAAVEGSEPDLPVWIPGLIIDSAEKLDKVNDWIYAHFADWRWSDVYENWRAAYDQMMVSAEAIPEIAFIDGNRYPWSDGFSIAARLVSTYEHHKEHFDPYLSGETQ